MRALVDECVAVARADESNARKADFRMDYIDPLNQALPSIIAVTLLALAAFFFTLLTWQAVGFWKRIAPTLERRMQVLLHAGRIVIILDPKSPGNPVNVLQPDRMFNPGERVVNGLMESVGGAAPQLQSVATAGACSLRYRAPTASETPVRSSVCSSGSTAPTSS